MSADLRGVPWWDSTMSRTACSLPLWVCRGGERWRRGDGQLLSASCGASGRDEDSERRAQQSEAPSGATLGARQTCPPRPPAAAHLAQAATHPHPLMPDPVGNTRDVHVMPPTWRRLSMTSCSVLRPPVSKRSSTSRKPSIRRVHSAVAYLEAQGGDVRGGERLGVGAVGSSTAATSGHSRQLVRRLPCSAAVLNGGFLAARGCPTRRMCSTQVAPATAPALARSPPGLAPRSPLLAARVR